MAYVFSGMAYIPKIEYQGNGAVEFFQQLRALLPEQKTAQVVILPTRVQGSYLLVRPYIKGVKTWK